MTEESKISDDEYLPDFTKLQPYLYESCVSKESVKENCPGLSDSEEDTSRIGNTLWWWSFRKYKPMVTHQESICCLDKYEIREGYYSILLYFKRYS